MNRGTDAMTGILFAILGIGILLAWRAGLLTKLLGLSPSSSSSSASQLLTKIGGLDVATALPTVSLVPVSVGPGRGAATGTVDNGFSSTWVSSPSWVAFRAGERQASPAAVVSGGGGGRLS